MPVRCIGAFVATLALLLPAAADPFSTVALEGTPAAAGDNQGSGSDKKAQPEEGMPPDETPEHPIASANGKHDFGLGISIKPSATIQSRSRFGDARMWDAGGGVAVRWFLPLGKDFSLISAVSIEESRYNWSRYSLLVPGVSRPIRDAWIARLAPILTLKLDPDWSVFGGIDVGLSAESGARLGESLNSGAFAGVKWRIIPEISISVGLGAHYGLDHRFRVLPTLGFEWRILDNLKLEIRGAGVRVAWRPVKPLEAVFSVRYESRQWRLDDDGQVPRGIASHSSVPLEAGLTWTVIPHLKLGVTLGATPWQSFRLKDHSGDTLSRETGRVAVFGGLSVGLEF